MEEGAGTISGAKRRRLGNHGGAREGGMGEGAGEAQGVGQAERYDRQIRLWGEAGQARLEMASVCLLGAGPLGSEVLKNLVLGGLGSFVVVDDAKVCKRDLGNSFFVSESSLGASRAKAVAELVNELNDIVKGTYLDANPASLVDTRPSYLQSFSLVVAAGLTWDEAAALDSICGSKAPEGCSKLLYVRACGLAGIVRPCYFEHCVVEARPESEVEDLRLADPWPELAEYCSGFDLDNLDVLTHKHVPYAVLLVKAASEWKNRAGTAGAPSGTAERDEFKGLVRSYARESGQENVAEASRAAMKVWSQRGEPSEDVWLLLMEAEAKPASSLRGPNGNFWALAKATKRFVEEAGDGKLPLEGSLPDMTSTTDAYVALQRLYSRKAEDDAAVVGRFAGEALSSAGIPADGLTWEEVRAFCRNARRVRALSTCPLSRELGASADSSKPGGPLPSLLGGEEGVTSRVNAWLYVMLRAGDTFTYENGRLPEPVDEGALSAIAERIARNHGARPENAQPSQELTREACRGIGAEVQPVAALLGGIASQEAIKLLSSQFVPVAGSLVWNFIHSSSSVLTF